MGLGFVHSFKQQGMVGGLRLVVAAKAGVSWFSRLSSVWPWLNIRVI
jgi:hypothetical protein